MSDATILVVDDEPANLTVLRRLLGGSYTVRVSKSGEAALEAVARDPHPDLVLLDVMMLIHGRLADPVVPKGIVL